MVSENYIKNAEPEVQELLYDTIYNMSFILGDNEGKLRDIQAKYVTSNLNVSPIGELQDLGGTISLVGEPTLGTETFDPKMTVNGFSIYNRLLNLDSELIWSPLVPDDYVLGGYLKKAKSVSDEVLSYSCYLFIELFSLYTALINYRFGDIFPITIEEIETLSSNCRYILAKIGLEGNQEFVYEVLYVVKRIHRSILFVKKNVLLLG